MYIRGYRIATNPEKIGMMFAEFTRRKRKY
ncbi:MAG: hypothetical protein QG558_598 [Campylobacterota bacterium]|nr:hypothetical protein [Campylobacterota bacterium]